MMMRRFGFLLLPVCNGVRFSKQLRLPISLNDVQPCLFAHFQCRNFSKLREKETETKEPLGKKLTSKLKSYGREKWHLRIKKGAGESIFTETQKLKDTPLDPSIMHTIDDLGLGKRRVKKKKKKEKLNLIQRPELPMRFLLASRKPENFLPENPSIPEVVFAGRSNVGKSSLLNAIAEGWKAKTSSKPGETRSINWYRLGNYIHLVDLPGYGFAFANQENLQQWQSLIHKFLQGRKSLKRAYLLVDSRHGLKSSDMDMIKSLSSLNITFQIIMTKADLVFPDVLAKRCYLVRQEAMQHKGLVLPVLMASAKNKAGIQQIRNEMMGLVPKLKLKQQKKNSSQQVTEKNSHNDNDNDNDNNNNNDTQTLTTLNGTQKTHITKTTQNRQQKLNSTTLDKTKSTNSNLAPKKSRRKRAPKRKPIQYVKE